MERLASFIIATTALVRRMPDDEADQATADTLTPMWAEFWHRTPPTTSTAGAASALKAMLLSDHIDDADERVLRSVLAFLDGGTDAEQL